MEALDRPGIFKAKLDRWTVEKADSGAIAVTCYLIPIAKLETDAEGANVWDDWTQYAPMECVGRYWVIKKDKTVNAGTVEQLVRSLGWNGMLASVGLGLPPKTVVQVTVKAEEWKGKIQHKAGWMNPEDFVPGGDSLEAAEVAKLDSQFGSLLRAAASSAGATMKAPPSASSSSRPKAPPRATRNDSIAPLGTDEPIDIVARVAPDGTPF